MSGEDKHDKVIGQLIERLQAIGEVLKELPSEARAQAFDLFKPYLSPSSAEHYNKAKTENVNADSDIDSEVDTSSMETFFGAFDHGKPADNVTLVAAWHYSQYGLAPLSKAQIDKIANDVGITTPSRPDMTLKQKTAKAKSCFRQQGRGGYVPTVHGEAFLKETYKVKRGKNTPPKEDADA